MLNNRISTTKYNIPQNRTSIYTVISLLKTFQRMCGNLHKWFGLLDWIRRASALFSSVLFCRQISVAICTFLYIHIVKCFSEYGTKFSKGVNYFVENFSNVTHSITSQIFAACIFHFPHANCYSFIRAVLQCGIYFG